VTAAAADARAFVRRLAGAARSLRDELLRKGLLDAAAADAEAQTRACRAVAARLLGARPPGPARGGAELRALLAGVDAAALARAFAVPDGDPLLHFYAPFLAAYDPAQRARRGVYCTPAAVAACTVRSAHLALQREFGLRDGLADATTWGELRRRHPRLLLPAGIAAAQPFVRILDPAAGTGTFLVEVVDVVHRTLRSRWAAAGLGRSAIAARWNAHVPALLAALHGRELLDAPRAVANAALLARLRAHGYAGRIGRAVVAPGNALADAADGALPPGITVVLGNPPWSYRSQSLDAASRALVDPFRSVGGRRIVERGALVLERALQDDYVKFFALALAAIERAGAGLFALVSNAAWLDAPQLRGLRARLCERLHRLRALDLGGGRVRREPGDENLFGIGTGVAIALGARLPAARPFALAAAELRGGRAAKTAALARADLLAACGPTFLPAPGAPFRRPAAVDAEYAAWPAVTDVFATTGVGIKTNRDHLVLGFDDAEIERRLRVFTDPARTTREVGRLLGVADNAQWTVARARAACRAGWSRAHFRSVDYRPFDRRRIYYHGSVVANPRPALMAGMRGDNLALLVSRRVRTAEAAHFFVTDRLCMAEMLSGADNCHVCPLWCDGRPNLRPAFLAQLAAALRRPADGEHGLPRGVAPGSLFHYLYAVCHAPGYRRRYAGALRADFARLPLPGSAPLFLALAAAGKDLVQMHLLRAPAAAPAAVDGARIDRPIIDGPIDRIEWRDGVVHVLPAPGARGEAWSFPGVQAATWEFRVGSHQPCRKWLADRRGRPLLRRDVAHYARLVAAVDATLRRATAIDAIVEAHGGWPRAFRT
jgi:hypothetical protein